MTTVFQKFRYASSLKAGKEIDQNALIILVHSPFSYDIITIDYIREALHGDNARI